MTVSGSINRKVEDYWVNVTDVIWPLVESEPAVAPAVYFWLIGEPTKNAVVTEKKGPSPPASRIKKEMTRLRERFLSGLFDTPVESCDVLFVPNSSRSNYLGACIHVAETLNDKAPDIRSGFIIPSHKPSILDGSGKKDTCSLYTYGKSYSISPRQIIKSINIFWRLKQCASGSPFAKVWIEEERAFKRWRKILSSLAAVRYARRWLKRVGCNLVVTPNEQWPPASVIVAAAKMEGIQTCQILHGMPNRFYWPFISDETWVWGPKTREMFLEYGAPEKRLQTIGGLEFPVLLSSKAEGVGKDRSPTDPSNMPSLKNSKTLLFLSQWNGRKEIGERDYREILDWIGEVLSFQKDKWQLLIRLHPNDEETSKDIYRGIFGDYKLKVGFSIGDTALKKDILGSDFVCSHSSTAILMALLLKTPCALLRSGDSTQMSGEPFLGFPFLATHKSELEQALKGTIQDEDYETFIGDLLGDPEITGQKSSQRVVDILENRNQP